MQCPLCFPMHSLPNDTLLDHVRAEVLSKPDFCAQLICNQAAQVGQLTQQILKTKHAVTEAEAAVKAGAKKAAAEKKKRAADKKAEKQHAADERLPCKFYLRTGGKCDYGDRCKFEHPGRTQEQAQARNSRKQHDREEYDWSDYNAGDDYW